MDVAVVVDASVWVSRFVSWDVNQSTSHVWIERYATAGGLLIAPAFFLVEVAAAISRRTGDPALARGVIKDIYYFSAMRILSLDSALVWSAVEMAVDLHLRAGDTTYVALARRLNIPLVSWDKEQLQRPGNLITTYTPSSYTF